jgi:hypothetical protein
MVYSDIDIAGKYFMYRAHIGNMCQALLLFGVKGAFKFNTCFL